MKENDCCGPTVGAKEKEDCGVKEGGWYGAAVVDEVKGKVGC